MTNDLDGNQAQLGSVTWWTHGETCSYLRVDPRTVAARMRQTPEDIERPWVNFGTPRRPFYRWLAGGVTRWWVEVNQRRNGEKPPGQQPRFRPGPGGRRFNRELMGTPKGRSTCADSESDRRPGQSLADYVRSLTVKKS